MQTNFSTSPNTSSITSVTREASADQQSKSKSKGRTVKLSDVRERLAQHIESTKKLPVNLKTVLNLTDNECLSYLKEIPGKGTELENKEAINRFIETIITPDLTNLQLQTVDNLIPQPHLKIEQLSEKEIDKNEFIHRLLAVDNNKQITKTLLGNMGWMIFPDTDSVDSRIKAINDITRWVYENRNCSKTTGRFNANSSTAQ